MDEHVKTAGAARIAERSTDTIRDWARRGIITPVMRPGGIRIYARRDVERVAREMDARRQAKRGSDGDAA